MVNVHDAALDATAKPGEQPGHLPKRSINITRTRLEGQAVHAKGSSPMAGDQVVMHGPRATPCAAGAGHASTPPGLGDGCVPVVWHMPRDLTLMRMVHVVHF